MYTVLGVSVHLFNEERKFTNDHLNYGLIRNDQNPRHSKAREKCLWVCSQRQDVD